MPYLPNIPAAADQISVSQGQIQGNFQAINTGFNQNHVGLNAAPGTAGQHTFVQLQPQAPTPAFAGIPGFWTSNVANDLMLHAIHPAVKDVNLTNYTCAVNGLGTGSFYLPCGIFVQFGIVAVVGGAGNIHYPIAYPAGHRPYVVLTGMQDVTAPPPFSTYASINEVAPFVFDNLDCNIKLRRFNPGSHLMENATGNVQWFAIGI